MTLSNNDLCVTELTETEMKGYFGGGWLSDIIAQIITDIKCGCSDVIDGDVARSGVGTIIR